jgi:ABC-type lipoprotein release transport system permease subunit
MNLTLASKSLLRARWRSALTAGGVGLAVALLVWTAHMADAFTGLMVDSATGVEIGHVQIQRAAYVDDPALYYAMDLGSVPLDAIRADPDVVAAAPRLRAFGLVGHERRSQVAGLIGVVATEEAALTGMDARLDAGEWLDAAPPGLPEPRQAVLGSGLARQLGVEPGGELVVLTQGADGSLGNDLLVVQGVVSTGNVLLDRQAVYMALDDVAFLTALDGRAHEIAVRLAPSARLEDARGRIRALVGSSGGEGEALSVRTWEEVVPELHQIAELSKSSMWIFYLIIYFIAGLGILNSQRMTALERRREMGVLLAIGLTPGRLAGQVLTEAALLSALGGVIGAAIGAAVSAWHAAEGLSLDLFSEDAGTGFSYMGVQFAGRLFFHFEASTVVAQLATVVLVGALSGLWPALWSARLNPSRAIAGRA